MTTSKKYPVTKRAIHSERTMPANHAWNRGYPNNKRLVTILTERQRRELEVLAKFQS
jgi:hypothetical protein